MLGAHSKIRSSNYHCGRPWTDTPTGGFTHQVAARIWAQRESPGLCRRNPQMRWGPKEAGKARPCLHNRLKQSWLFWHHHIATRPLLNEECHSVAGMYAQCDQDTVKLWQFLPAVCFIERCIIWHNMKNRFYQERGKQEKNNTLNTVSCTEARTIPNTISLCKAAVRSAAQAAWKLDGMTTPAISCESACCWQAKRAKRKAPRPRLRTTGQCLYVYVPATSKGSLLVGFMYLKASNKHPLNVNQEPKNMVDKWD